MKKVFISYGRKDLESAEKLVKKGGEDKAQNISQEPFPPHYR
jgi:hypothetical protein